MSEEQTKLLQLRNIVAAREFNTAMANRELQECGGWSWDYKAIDIHYAEAFDDLLRPRNTTPDTGQKGDGDDTDNTE
jgi:hypothetical protein